MNKHCGCWPLTCRLPSGRCRGIDFARKTFQVDGAKVKFEIWDTAGQERFRTITRFQFRGTKELDQQNKEPVPVFIIGNKCDLQEQREVTPEMGEKMAESSYVHGFMETSALDNTNVPHAFHQLAQAMTEINNPKLLNAYLCPMERRERDTRRMAAILNSQPSSRYSVNLNRPAKKRKHKCAC
ncbi:Ras-related protein Rab-8B [Lamellibrachia satsuma]|nr:Ras-related protein Rab-8B [Lamellibrachia satsuma]